MDVYAVNLETVGLRPLRKVTYLKQAWETDIWQQYWGRGASGTLQG